MTSRVTETDQKRWGKGNTAADDGLVHRRQLGSPVLDASSHVIGLHHFGFTDDAVVRRNQAVLMRRIVAGLPADVKAALTP